MPVLIWRTGLFACLWVEEEEGVVFQLRQCLYKYINCMSFELESGDGKA